MLSRRKFAVSSGPLKRQTRSACRHKTAVIAPHCSPHILSEWRNPKNIDRQAAMNWKDPTVVKILLLTFAALTGYALTGYGATIFEPPEFRDGDLIFQETAGRQSAAVLAATGSPFTHMGIVRLRDEKPVIVEAIGPVQETPLEEWLARGEGNRYALYRVRDLPAEAAAKMFQAAERYYGRPYDILFRPTDDAIYCSELPQLAFAAAGIELGRAQPLRDLNIDAAAVTALIADRWRKHPDCKGAASMTDCVQTIRDQPIVTPASIAEDTDVELVYSDF